MSNKRALQIATKELNKAKAPSKPKDIIYDPAGQWKFPGQNTRIPGGDITMQGVPYPVYGEPNIGEPQMMYPGQDYVFPGASYVDEYPQMKKGGRPRGLVQMPKPSKKGLASKAYSRSLDATNKLFTENRLFEKPKDRRRKVFDPNAKYYAKGGEQGCPEGYAFNPKTGECIEWNPDIRESYDQPTSFDPVGDIINMNPNDRPEGMSDEEYAQMYNDQLEHEQLHRLQWKNDELKGESKTPLRMPSTVDNEDFGGDHYYNRRGEEVNYLHDYWKNHHPNEAAFIPDDVIYNYETDPAMYQLPWTVEGEARGYEYETHEGRPSLFPKQQDGGEYGMPLGTGRSQNYLGRKKHFYPNGGDVSVEGYNEDSPWLGEEYKDLGATLTKGRFNVSAGNYFPTKVNQPTGMINPYISAGVDLNKGRNLSFEATPGYTGFTFTKSFKVGGIPELPLRDNQVNYDAYVNRFEPKTRLYEDGGIIAELTDDEIQAYRDGGYIVEDISIPSLNQYDNGGGIFKRRKKKKQEQVQPEYVEPVEVDDEMYESVTPYTQAPEDFKQGVGNIKEVEVAPGYIDISREYSKKYPKQDYINERKREYLKGTNQGLNRVFGYDMENFPEQVERNFERAYNYKRNSYIVKELGKRKGFSPKRRGEWIDALTPAERNVVANSKYESKLQPSLWDRTLAGLGTLAAPFSPEINAAMNRGDLPGLTKKEQREIKDSKITKVPFTDIDLPFGIPVGGLESAVMWDYPGLLLGNAVQASGNGTFGSDYREAPNALSAQPMAGVTNKVMMTLNPLNYTIPYDIAAAAPSIIRGVKNIPGVLKTTGKLLTEERPLTNLYDKVATGNSSLPIAWKVEKPLLTPKSSEYIARAYTAREAELLSKYGKGMNLSPEEWKEMETLVKSGATDFSKGNIPISRIPLYYSRSEQAIKEAEQINKLKLWQKFNTPSDKNIRTWSAGIPEGYSPERLARAKPIEKMRLVIPSKYTKNLGSEFAGMPYYDKRVSFIWNPETGKINSVAVGEKELMGNIPEGFQVIGRSNEGGMENIIIKPIKGSKKLSRSVNNSEIIGLSDYANPQYRATQAKFNMLFAPESKSLAGEEMLNDFRKRIRTPEGLRRLKDLGINDVNKFDDLVLKEIDNEIAYFTDNPFTGEHIALHKDMPADITKKITRHELEHAVQRVLGRPHEFIKRPFKKEELISRGGLTEIDDILENLDFVGTPSETFTGKPLSPVPIEMPSTEKLFSDPQRNLDYFVHGSAGKEKSAFLGEIQQSMLEDGIVDDVYENITPEKVKEAYTKSMENPAKDKYKLRLFEIIKPTNENFSKLSKGLNKMLSLAAPVTIGAAALQQEKDGGIVSELSQKEIQDLIAQGYIVEDVD